jgi:hypothetical protein
LAWFSANSSSRRPARYLVELKFTASQADAPDVDSLRSKVDDKADNTMGVMVSISGYTSVAISQASGRKTTLLLLDAVHLYLFLSGALSFKDILARVRRHASQTVKRIFQQENSVAEEVFSV